MKSFLKRQIQHRPYSPAFFPCHSFSGKESPAGTPSTSTGKALFVRVLKFYRMLLQMQINSFTAFTINAHRVFKIPTEELDLSVTPQHQVNVVQPDVLPKPSCGVLPTSVQESLKELKARRERIMELLSSIDVLKSENQQLIEKYRVVVDEKTSAVQTQERIRDSFQGIDQRFIDLRNDVITLREVESKYKVLQGKHNDLQVNYDKLSKGLNLGGHTENAHIKSLLSSREQEVQRLEKRIERLRNQSPCVASLQSIYMAIEKASDSETFHHNILGEELAAMQRKYAAILTEDFPKHSTGIGARELIAKTCEEYVRSSFFYGSFDCVVQCPAGIDSRLLSYLSKHVKSSFLILRHSNSSIEVVCPSKCSCVGPYGILTCFRLAFPEAASKLTVYPTLHKKTIDEGGKVHISHETCKSSKPGGQASNVTETQVKSALTFNGRVIARAHSQDTRSQSENKKRAEQRLLGESLRIEIEKLQASPPIFKGVDIHESNIAEIRYLLEPKDFQSDLYIQSVLRIVK